MSEERKIPEKLVERIDELLVVLNRLVEDLREISITLKSIAVSQITQPTAPQPAAPTIPKTIEKTQSIDDIKMMFPEDLESLLNFEEKDEYIIIKPRQFLGSENFAKIASVVRGIGGDYVSAGKASHFRVPKKKT
ncbi:MAG: hypothetical protein ACP5IM_05355 [Candidatus Bathyarchaeia archaeon]|nr:MAG: hypothetical protein C0195_01005 [Candidatus Bathyarchaeota archaeon]